MNPFVNAFLNAVDDNNPHGFVTDVVYPGSNVVMVSFPKTPRYHFAVMCDQNMLAATQLVLRFDSGQPRSMGAMMFSTPEDAVQTIGKYAADMNKGAENE
jgi:hypothetical protein